MSAATAMSRRRHGGAMVYTVIVLLVLIGFVGLAIDWGYMTWTAQKLQNAADAAALAGAQQVWLSHSNAREAAVNLASLNEAGSKPVALNSNIANDAAGDIVIGHYDRAAKTFTATTDRQVTNAVRVVARRTTGSAAGPLPLFFGPIFQKKTAEVARYGIAIAIGGPAENSVIALNSKDPKSFYISGNGYLDLGEGSAQVDSNSGAGAVFQGTSLTFKAGQVNMVGAWDEKGNPNLNSVDLNPHEAYVADPLAGLPVPAIGSAMTPPMIDPVSSAVTHYYPGYYPKGLHLNNDDNAFLHPGVYILENGTKKATDPAFDIAGHATLTGYGVMFYIKFGNVELNGTGDVHITAPDAGVYKGIQFFQARDNTTVAHFNGTGLLTGTASDVDSGAGTFYFPKATVTLNGTGDMFMESLVSDKIEVGGDGRKTITKGYDGRHGGDAVYLVE
jgi:Flp pilus assembly protein TadG